MSLIKRIKSLLGLNGAAHVENDRPVAVTVEHDPEPAEETEPEEIDAGEESAEPDVEEEPELEETGAVEDDRPVTDVSGIGPSYSERLADAGIETVGELAAADPETIASETDLSEKRVGGWIDAAAELASSD